MEQIRRYYILNQDAVNAALKAKGFRSFSELAKKLGIHRNTISHYMTGSAPLPHALERILAALEMPPEKILSTSGLSCTVAAQAIAALVDRLNHAAPECVFVIFGSRARGDEKRFSDFDLGVFKAEGIEFTSFSRLLDLVAQWNGEQMSTVQLCDLSSAENEFLISIRKDLRFLTGSLQEWLSLLAKLEIKTYARSKMA